MTKKDILIYVLLAGVFSLFGYTIKSSKIVIEKEIDKVEVTKTVVPEDIQALKERLLEIEQVDLEEYKSLKSQKEKYLKANEIYGKVFVLFLTSLSLELNKESWEPVVNYASSGEYASELEERLNDVNEETERYKEQVSAYQKVNSNKNRKKTIKERRLEKVLDNYVNKASFDRANKEWLKRLKGTYSGTISYKSKTDATMVLESNYALVNGKITGEGRVILSDEKGDFSTNRSNGSNMLFKGIKKQNTLYVDLMPGAFAELKYHSDDTFSGTIYENESGKYKQVGKVSLLSRD